MVTVPTILVIDDDPDIRADLQMILEDHGYRIISADGGIAGINLVKKERPDLVIVDMMMPKVSGFIVLETIKQDIDPTIPVIMLTANESEEQKNLAELLGVDAYLQKPIGSRDLLTMIKSVCRVPGELRGPTAQFETVMEAVAIVLME